MNFSDKCYDEVSDFVSKFVKEHKDFEYYELLDAVDDKFHFSDMTDEDLNHCIQDAWGNETSASTYPYGVLGAKSQARYLQDISRYSRIFHTGKIQNNLLAVALTKIKEPLLIRKLCDDINPKEARKLFNQFPNLKEKLPLKLREKIYPSKMTLIKPLIMYHLLSKENQEKLLRDLENNALPMYLLIRKYPMLKKPAILFKLLSKENQERFKKDIKRVLPINALLNKKDNANKKYKRGI